MISSGEFVPVLQRDRTQTVWRLQVVPSSAGQLFIASARCQFGRQRALDRHVVFWLIATARRWSSDLLLPVVLISSALLLHLCIFSSYCFYRRRFAKDVISRIISTNPDYLSALSIYKPDEWELSTYVHGSALSVLLLLLQSSTTENAYLQVPP